MMNIKKALILAAVLAALATLYFLSERTAAKKERKTEVALVANFDAAQAAAITITAPGKAAVVLKKYGDAWKLTAGGVTYAAETAAVTSLLGQVVKIKSATVASKNPKNFDSFEISDAKAVNVKIDDAGGKALAQLLLGKNGPDIFSTYVRAKDALAVYLVPGLLKNMADRELKDWRDKTIWKLNGDRIAQYTVAGDKNLWLRKDSTGAWQAVCNGRAFAAGNDAANYAVQSFAKITAVDFVDENPKEARLDKPLRTITAVFSDGAKEALFVGGDKNAFQQFVKAESQQQIFIVEKSEIESFSPSCEGLKKSDNGSDNATVKAGAQGER